MKTRTGEAWDSSDALMAWWVVASGLVSVHQKYRLLLDRTRFASRFAGASIIPLAHQPVNDSECDYREAQCDDSQRGCRLNIEDNEFSCERQNADEHHRLDLYDAVKALH